MRESDGLAFSSRNRYLSAAERGQAPVLFVALRKAAEMAARGEKSAMAIMGHARKTIETASLARIDYVELVHAENLRQLDLIQANALLAVAVYFGTTRLIDNIQLG